MLGQTMKRYFYATNFEEVVGAHWFRVVLASIHPFVRQKPCMLGFELSPILELCPFEKIRMKSDACHIL